VHPPPGVAPFEFTLTRTFANYSRFARSCRGGKFRRAAYRARLANCCRCQCCKLLGLNPNLRRFAELPHRSALDAEISSLDSPHTALVVEISLHKNDRPELGNNCWRRSHPQPTVTNCTRNIRSTMKQRFALAQNWRGLQTQ